MFPSAAECPIERNQMRFDRTLIGDQCRLADHRQMRDEHRKTSAEM